MKKLTLKLICLCRNLNNFYCSFLFTIFSFIRRIVANLLIMFQFLFYLRNSQFYWDHLIFFWFSILSVFFCRASKQIGCESKTNRIKISDITRTLSVWKEKYDLSFVNNYMLYVWCLFIYLWNDDVHFQSSHEPSVLVL